MAISRTIPRQISVAASGRLVNLDAIANSGFDLNFYRQFVGYTPDVPYLLEPLRLWTRAPLIYLKTPDEAGQPIDAAQLESTSTTIQEAAAQWSAGHFGVAGSNAGRGRRRA